MKRATLFSAALAASLTVFAGAAGAAISGDVVKIGVMTDLSGVYLDYAGKGSVEAAKMAIEDFGNGLPGKKIELVTADHQNKADIGSAKAREWIDRDGVDAIVDLPNSSVALAVSRIASEKKRISLITGGANLRHTNEECSPYIVHYVYDTYALANVAGKAMVKQGLKSWYFLTADYAFGASLETATADVVKASGGSVVGQVKHPLNASDFSSFVLQAQSSKAQVVALANGGGDTINAIKAANDFGLPKNQTLVGLLMTISDVHSLGLKLTQGMKMTDAWYWDLNPQTRDFGSRFFSRMKRMPNMVHAGTYSAVLQYLKAVQATGSDDSDTVMAALKKAKINDAFAQNAYIRADGRMMHDMYLMEVKKPADSRSPWDYLKLVATVPAEEAFQPLSQSRCPLVKK
ncbi:MULTISPECIES: ABC transporter substrate-binding protein [unclassified Cupriavidus]|uniref:ABC transporter substrate-binding protein n=1 Tax=unclassified Cupriavidus TaxID=2640874 RepID=UPI001C0062DF|nr:MULTISPECIES: ABC transporter substrate-binding protein [unclassified Cupriavidus]MCA3186265.1 ABC transporter substrate-binding protein [Cupriavidus sp.]MCA3191633.1 ABC transporter substrate-binding protein [Cupriavidus sp.]MCA3199772.1 ABC transporter substrate-binding protein [Cupriavidus sp.]MCA3205492.1 ABC transporter substrate-binding protein [Cupriavidus sp.]MCA3206114.1 ABC transporter substrate-binding protein [Cupriavidus sp.]